MVCSDGGSFGPRPRHHAGAVGKTTLDWRVRTMDTNGARAYETPGEQEPSPAEALRRLQQQVGELQAYLAHFVSAKVDGFVLSARQLALWAALGVVGLI